MFILTWSAQNIKLQDFNIIDINKHYLQTRMNISSLLRH